MGNKSKKQQKEQKETKQLQKKVMKKQKLEIGNLKEIRSKKELNEETLKARKKAIIKIIEWYIALKEEQITCYENPPEYLEEYERQLVICKDALKQLKKVENDETLIQVEMYVNSTFASEVQLNIQSYAYAFAISSQESTRILDLDAKITHQKSAEFFNDLNNQKEEEKPAEENK